jgi:hypothetical protein
MVNSIFPGKVRPQANIEDPTERRARISETPWILLRVEEVQGAEVDLRVRP